MYNVLFRERVMLIEPLKSRPIFACLPGFLLFPLFPVSLPAFRSLAMTFRAFLSISVRFYAKYLFRYFDKMSVSLRI